MEFIWELNQYLGMHIPGLKGGRSYPLPGPGLLIALSSSGWIGLLSLITFGADSGFAFIGITLITLLFKYSLITGIGRFTLASGKDIFVGLSMVPGPKNWAIWMVNGILYLEIFMLGFSSITMVRFLSEVSGLSLPPMVIIFIIFIILFILISLDSYSIFRAILLRCILFILVGFGLITYSMSIPSSEIIAGLIPDMSTYSGVYEMAIILSSVGSGFSLLFFSPWVLSNLKNSASGSDKKIIYRRIQVDAAMGMLFLFILTFIYFSIGFFFLYEHGLEAPEPDLTLGIIFTVMNLGNYGSMIFAVVSGVTLFCSLFGGLYGRSRVFEITLPRTIPGFHMTKKVYLIMVACLILSAICAEFVWNQAMVREFIAIRLILFSILTGLLMLVDFRLGPKARGSRVWYGVMATGTIISCMLGINLFGRYFL